MARQPTKCCGCVPLRPGLLAWAYIKLVVALTSIGVWVYGTRYEMRLFVDNVNFISRYRSPADYIFEQLWPLGVCLLYLVFSIIFIIGVHRQNSKLLLVFLVYSIFEVILGAALIGLQLYKLVDYITHHHNLESLLHEPVFYLQFIIPFVVYMLLPIYLIALIKSEVQRLKRARGETRVVLDTPVTQEQDKSYNFVYSNETPVRGKPLFPVEELERLRQQLGVKNV